MQSYFIRQLLKVCDNNANQAKQELRWIIQHALNQTRNSNYNCNSNNIQQFSQKENQKLSQLKTLDIQVCSFCQKTNLLNLG